MDMLAPDNLDAVFYSLQTAGFYPERLRAAYDAAGSWPADAVLIPAERLASIQAAVAEGATVSLDSHGQWIVTARAPTPYVQLAAAYLNAVRAAREAVLNRLAGIGFAAMMNGETDIVEGAIDARQALLDITICPSVVAAQDIQALQAAIKGEYDRIAASLPDEARRAFDDAGIALVPPIAQ
ncbi:hypothetical protein [Janthinobacterium sp. GMG1]|uniref:hypothetical protein n=1 Tax=Janthinobacterium sp. GMG1 TaxID=3096007 RepID=UPI002ACA5366|nr:hypothetical protein [Janthinobacterium sp. GMG1]MDZ5634470.1 hypothetical protein [Janthinobacterium sp. GMG1]